MAVDGGWAIRKAKRDATERLVGRERRYRRVYLRGDLDERRTVELAAVRLVLAERQVKLEPQMGLPELI